MNTYENNSYNTHIHNVKMSSTWEQFAWIHYYVNPSETKRSTFYSKNDHIINDKEFCQWLVGITDGDGSFSFIKNKNGSWNFNFKIGQSNYNIRMLYYIKSKIKVGSVSITNSKDNCAEYRIRDINHIIQYIIPVFDNNILLTKKYYDYIKFKNAINIYIKENKNKENIIIEIKNKICPENYISPVWSVINYNANNINNIKKVISKSWLVGFTEAEGSFYLVKKGPSRISHCFEITQKKDKIVLKAISLLLDMKVIEKDTYFSCVTTNQASVHKVIDYFFKTIKGIKSLEYRIWSRSFRKKNSFEELMKIQNMINKIRNNYKNKSKK